jgi:endonuclease/exonuclease/phosphatase family metal-dependent hydrolase
LDNKKEKRSIPRLADSWWKLLLLVGLLLITALYVSNASIPGSRVEGCGKGCATVTGRPEAGFRVVSLNMLHGFPLFKHLSERIDLIAAEIQRLDADVVLLQEVPWTIRTGNVAKLLGQRLGYNYLYIRADGNKNLILFEQGEAILSRYDLTDPRFIAYTSRASYFDRRVALGVTVLTPWGNLGLVVTHLTSDSLSVAELQAKQLQDFVEAQANVVTLAAGDFNSPENSPQILKLAQVWQDTYRAIHPNEPGYTCCIDDLQAQAEKPVNERIDYIFLAHHQGDSWKVSTAEKVFDHAFAVNNGWQWASDHEGLMVEIQP